MQRMGSQLRAAEAILAAVFTPAAASAVCPPIGVQIGLITNGQRPIAAPVVDELAAPTAALPAQVESLTDAERQ